MQESVALLTHPVAPLPAHRLVDVQQLVRVRIADVHRLVRVVENRKQLLPLEIVRVLRLLALRDVAPRRLQLHALAVLVEKRPHRPVIPRLCPVRTAHRIVVRVYVLRPRERTHVALDRQTPLRRNRRQDVLTDELLALVPKGPAISLVGECHCAVRPEPANQLRLVVDDAPVALFARVQRRLASPPDRFRTQRVSPQVVHPQARQQADPNGRQHTPPRRPPQRRQPLAVLRRRDVDAHDADLSAGRVEERRVPAQQCSPAIDIRLLGGRGTPFP